MSRMWRWLMSLWLPEGHVPSPDEVWESEQDDARARGMR